MDRLEQAVLFARHAHRSQFRKFPGPDGLLAPFITHPAGVASLVGIYAQRRVEHCTIVAWLHDVVEDTEVDQYLIELMLGTEVGRDVEKLTRAVGMSHEQYVCALHTASPAAKLVKGCDVLHNLRDSTHAPSDFKHRMIGKAEQYLTVIDDELPRDLGLDILRAVENLRRTLA